MLENLMAIDEVYFGKTEAVQDIFNAIAKARQKYMNTPKNKLSSVTGLKSDKDIMAIGKAIEDTFGFYVCDFNVIPDRIINAWTEPVIYTLGIEPEKCLIAYKGGYKYDKKLKYCTFITITSPIFCNSDYTDAEVTAIILHEIGHNFVVMSEETHSIPQKFREVCSITKLSQAVAKVSSKASNDEQKNPDPKPREDWNLYDYYYQNDVKLDRAKVDQELKDDPDAALKSEKSQIFWNNVKHVINDVLIATNKVTGMEALTKLTYALAGDRGRQSSDLVAGRAQEFLSDSFATIYGYGPELASGLYKLDTSTSGTGVLTRVANMLPHVMILNKFLTIPYLFAVYAMDVHPNTAYRIQKAISELENEVKKSDIDPRLKKEIQNNLDELKKQKEEITNVKKIKFFDRAKYAKLFVAKAFKRDTYETEKEKKYTDMEKRDEYFDKIFREGCLGEVTSQEYLQMIDSLN